MQKQKYNRLFNLIVEQAYAVKAVVKNRLNDMEIFRNEIRILSELDHPNIVSIYEVWETPEILSIVSE